MEEAQVEAVVKGSLGKKSGSTAKRAGDVAQVMECLPSKCKALSSNPNTTKGKLMN
jgi:hypothetical protein